MAESAAPLHVTHPAHRPTPPGPAHPSPAVKRQQVVAARTSGGGPAPHPAVYQPWQGLMQKADARLKTEITDAIRQLESAIGEAGQILDTTSSAAAEAAASLEAAAWAAWEKYMSAADVTRNAILDKARAEYSVAIGRAHDQYDKALGGAVAAYQSIINDATAAQSAAKQIVA